jgi:hypothetical protein
VNRFAERAALLQKIRKARDGLPKPRSGGVVLLTLKRVPQAQAGVCELGKLMIEFAALSEPAGRGKSKHRTPETQPKPSRGRAWL